MATGVDPGVLVLPSADLLPLPPPPGVVVVTSPHAGRTARELTRLLAVEACLRPVEARAELERRRESDLGEPRDRLRRRRAEAAAVRSEAAAARARLSPGVADLEPAAVRRAARAVAGALEALDTARATLGRRPPLDHDAARAAHQAQADVERSRRERYSGLPQANSLLAMANGGAAALVAGRLVTDAFDPAFFLVAVLPLGALAYTARTVLASMRRCRAAARRRWTALRSLDVSTMAGLAALEARAEAWTSRAARLAAAEGEVQRSQQAWRSLVGDGVDVGDVDRVVADLQGVARLDTRSGAAAAAWAEAAAHLQRAEDLAGSGHQPLVVLDARRSARPETRRRTVEELARLAGTASIVVVEPQVARVRPAVPAPATAPAPAPEGGAVVDLRERVLAGLQRLRSRPARAHRSPPGSVATGG